MRHVMALRVSKAVLVFAIALLYMILVLNNITDYGSNYEFVRHVLMMDSIRGTTSCGAPSIRR
jgi:predicted small integral membrane protein